MFKVEVILEMRGGHHRSLDYWFSSEEEYQQFKAEEKKKEHLHKIISEIKHEPLK